MNKLLKIIIAAVCLAGLAWGAPPPDLPVFAPLGSQTVDFGETLNFTVAATAPKGQTLFYEAANLPAGAALNPRTGLFVWTPSIFQLGTYRVTFAAWDRLTTKHMAYKSVTVQVNFRKIFSERGWGLKAGQPQVLIQTDDVRELYPDVKQLEIDGAACSLTQESCSVPPSPVIRAQVFSYYDINQKTVAVLLDAERQKNIVISDVLAYGGEGRITSLVVEFRPQGLKPGRHSLLIKAGNELGASSQSFDLVVGGEKAR
ncbi:MAG TPA: Ig domain-containing protein [Candidatus Sulfotelmatobacter sp.]|nr:Ig domain-containing protein [Candidatus Sulfotelmatobacter sp.]